MIYISIEQELVERSQQGDHGGFAELVTRYQIQAVRIAYAITGDRALAEDVAQEAFIQAFRAIRNVRTGEPFGPWFYRILVNQARRQLSKGRWGKWLSLKEAVTIPDRFAGEALERAVDRNIIWEAVKTLPVEFKTVVALRYLLDMNESEMAQTLQVPAGTVKSRLYRARKQLQEKLTVSSQNAAKEESKWITSTK